MEKIAVGPAGRGVDRPARGPPPRTCGAMADAKGATSTISRSIILDRPRHEELDRRSRASAGRASSSSATATSRRRWRPASRRRGVDVLMGTGGAPEGVIAAAALRCVGGDIQGRLKPRNDGEVERAEQAWASPTSSKIYSIDELAQRQRDVRGDRRHQRRLPRGRALLRRRRRRPTRWSCARRAAPSATSLPATTSSANQLTLERATTRRRNQRSQRRWPNPNAA